MISSILNDYKTIYNTFSEVGKSYPTHNLTEQDKKGVFDRELWNHFSSHGITGLALESKYGGKGYSALRTCVAFEALAHSCKNNGLIFSSIAHLLACALPIDKYGSEKQKELYLPQLASGKWIAANGITELNTGSDVYKMAAEGIEQNGKYILNGEKRYVTNAPVSDVVLLYVTTDKQKGFFGGVSCFVTKSDHPGIKLSVPLDKMGLNSAQMGNVIFKDLYLEEKDRIGKPGAGGIVFSESMMWERVVVSAFLAGQLERLLENAIRYVKERKLADRPLMDIQHVRHVLADIKVVLSAGKNMVYDAAFALDAKSKDALTKTSAAKLFVSENTVNAVKQLQQLYGAYGYLAEGEIEREYRDCYASLIYSGTSAIQKNIISTGF